MARHAKPVFTTDRCLQQSPSQKRKGGNSGRARYTHTQRHRKSQHEATKKKKKDTTRGTGLFWVFCRMTGAGGRDWELAGRRRVTEQQSNRAMPCPSPLLAGKAAFASSHDHLFLLRLFFFFWLLFATQQTCDYYCFILVCLRLRQSDRTCAGHPMWAWGSGALAGWQAGEGGGDRLTD